MTTRTKLVTYDDYRTLPDDGKRYEIIGGELLMTPSPKTIHQRISQRLAYELENYIRKHQLGEILSAPIDVVLSMTDVVQPDLIFVSKERSHIITKNNIVEAPDMVIEIVSDSTEAVDRNNKKALYEMHGVKEYWIVDPAGEQIDQFLLENGALEMKGTLKKSDTLLCNVIEGCSLKLDYIFKS